MQILRKEDAMDMTESERNDAQMALIYNIRLTLQENEKDTFTKEEILQLLDTIASTKRQK